MSDNIVHFKSKERINQLGEVFTPPHIANQMLDMLDQKHFEDPNKLFFEPCCGTGNIFCEIVKRRLDVAYKAYIAENQESADRWAIAFTASTTYACDIDESNVLECRDRIKKVYLNFYEQKSGLPWYLYGKDAWTPVFNLIDENIQHADALAGLEIDYDKAYEAAKKVKTSHEFFKKNGHVILKCILDCNENTEIKTVAQRF